MEYFQQGHPSQLMDQVTRQVEDKFSHFPLFLLESIGLISEDTLMETISSLAEDTDHLIVRGMGQESLF